MNPASSIPAAAGGGAQPTPSPQSRFKLVVQSPLRAALVRHFFANRQATFDAEGLMQTFGRLRADLENCLRDLAGHGLIERRNGSPPRFGAASRLPPGIEPLLEEFLARRSGSRSPDEAPSVQRFREMIGRDEKMILVFEAVRTVAKTDLSVLILGPTGSGKEVVARMIHEISPRRDQRFQAVNCAALPDTLFESELFGFERGAFTGAYERKPGRIELANHGTLFLDEIGDLALAAQAKLLRVVEDRRVERLGGRGAVDVDFRLICATHQPLDSPVGERRFREDLYYRINAFTLRLPSLRERPVDIPILAGRFLDAYCVKSGLPASAKRFSAEAVERLVAYPWPGNIRELETTVARAALSAASEVIRPEDITFLHAAFEPRLAAAAPELLPLRAVERAHVQRVLDAVGWNKKKAARVLEISRETLYRKIAEYSLSPTATRDRPQTVDADAGGPQWAA